MSIFVTNKRRHPTLLIALGLYFSFQGFGAVIGGFIADLHGRRKALLSSTLTTGLGIIILSSSYFWKGAPPALTDTVKLPDVGIEHLKVVELSIILGSIAVIGLGSGGLFNLSGVCLAESVNKENRISDISVLVCLEGVAFVIVRLVAFAVFAIDSNCQLFKLIFILSYAASVCAIALLIIEYFCFEEPKVFLDAVGVSADDPEETDLRMPLLTSPQKREASHFNTAYAKKSAIIRLNIKAFTKDLLGIALPSAIFTFLFYGDGLTHFLLVEPQQGLETDKEENLFILVVLVVSLFGYLIALVIVRKLIPKLAQILGFTVIAFALFGLALCLYRFVLSTSFFSASFSISHSVVEVQHPSISEFAGASLLYDCFFRFFNFTPAITTYLLPLDACSTRIRSIFVGICAAASRLGALLGMLTFWFFFDHQSSCRSAILLAGSCLAVLGAALTRSLTPCTKHPPTQEETLVPLHFFHGAGAVPLKMPATVVRFNRNYQLLYLENSESCLLERQDGHVRIIAAPPATHTRTPFGTPAPPTPNRGRAELVKRYVQALRESSSQSARSATVRLCSRSLVIEIVETQSALLKILFSKINAVFFLKFEARTTPDPPDGGKLETGCRLLLQTSALVEVPVTTIGNTRRHLRPYVTKEGPWLIEIQLSDLKQLTKPLPTWLSLDLISLLNDQEAGARITDPLFFFQFTNLFISTIIAKAQAINEARSPNSRQQVTIFIDNVLQKLESATPAPSSFPYVRLDHRESFLFPSKAIRVKRQLPMQTVRGLLCMTDKALYFQPFPPDPLTRFNWSDLRVGTNRVVGLSDIGLRLIYAVSLTTSGELGLPSSRSIGGGTRPLYSADHHSLRYQGDRFNREGGAGEIMLYELNLLFESGQEREGIKDIIRKMKLNVFSAGESDSFLKEMTSLWQNRLIDNFDYLEFLNFRGGRSREDFSQYPVMPWTYVNFSSSSIDLSDENNYRNLTTPVGAINKDKLQLLEKRMEDMSESQSFTSKFLFGTHYSTAADVIYWLVRLIPESQLKLQGGKFDAWPRLFHSLEHVWKGLESGKATSFMELIPEFYEFWSPEFLENSLGVNVCALDTEKAVSPNSGILPDVLLPPWASGNGSLFLKIMREALESEIVSKRLPAWIDLIFGHLQRGPQAEAARNLFHPMTYFSSLCISKEKGGPGVQKKDLLPDGAFDSTTAEERAAMLTQVKEFGQAPPVLFEKPHAQRKSTNPAAPDPPLPTDIEANYAYPRSVLPWYMKLDVFHPAPKIPLSSSKAKVELPTPIDKEDEMAGLALALESQVNTMKSFEEAISASAAESRETDASKFVRFRSSHLLKKTKGSGVVLCSAFESERNLSVFGTSEGYLRYLDVDEEESARDYELAIDASAVCAISAVKGGVGSSMALGLKSGECLVVQHKAFSSDEKPATLLHRLKQDNLVPHGDAISTIDVCEVGAISASLDGVVSFWTFDPSSFLRTTNVIDRFDVSSVCRSNDLAFVATRGGEMEIFDLRAPLRSLAWKGSVDRTVSAATAVRDINLGGLLSGRSTFTFSVWDLPNSGGVGSSEDLQTALPSWQRLPRIGHAVLREGFERWRSRSGLVKSSNCLVAAGLIGDLMCRLPPFQTCKASHLYDLRMLSAKGQPESLFSRKNLPTLESALIGQHDWLSVDRQDIEPPMVTVSKGDGCRWAITAGVAASGNTQYGCVSVSDLSQGGLKAKEICRWPLEMGSATPDLPLLMKNGLLSDQGPSLLSDPLTWRLTEKKLRTPCLWVGSPDGQIEIINA